MTSDVYQTIKQFFEDEMCNYIRLLFAIKGTGHFFETLSVGSVPGTDHSQIYAY